MSAERYAAPPPLTGRIRELAERYATPLPGLVGEVEALAARVAGDLATMRSAMKKATTRNIEVQATAIAILPDQFLGVLCFGILDLNAQYAAFG